MAPPAASGNGRTFVSPVVARIAAEQGVDPSAVPGTGTGGRVTKKDILAYIESGAAQPAAAAPAAPRAGSRGACAAARARRPRCRRPPKPARARTRCLPLRRCRPARSPSR